MVEAVIRHHIGACFSALQEAVLRAVQQAEPLSGSKPQLLPVRAASVPIWVSAQHTSLSAGLQCSPRHSFRLQTAMWPSAT